MGKLRSVEDCPHKSIIRREAAAGVPLNGLYCLDCGACVKRGPGVGEHVTWLPTGSVMEATVLAELRAKLNWENDPPANIRLAEDAPGYARASMADPPDKEPT